MKTRLVGNTRSVLVLFVLALATTRPGLAVAEDIDRLYVVDGLGETLTLIDRADSSVTINVMTLGLVPNRIRYDGEHLLVVNSISDDLWVIDPETYDVTNTIEFDEGDNPWDVIVISDNLWAVSLLVAGEVAFVDPVGESVLTRVAVGKGPEGMLMVDGDLWVANTGFDFNTFLYDPGTISVIDLETMSVTATIPVGTNPQALVHAPDTTVHVVCTGNYYDQFGIVYVIDPSTRSVVDSIPFGGSPGDIAIDCRGNGYLAAGGYVDDGEIYRYDAVTRTVLNDSSDPLNSGQGVGQVIPRLEGGVYAVCFGADQIFEHNATGSILLAWEVGDGPVSMALVTNRRPGDLNHDGILNVLDVVSIVNIAFRGGALPDPPGSADVNADCRVDVMDVVMIVNVVFRGWSDTLCWGCTSLN
ncbi:MAG TPA: YncE family protein [Acidobacteriota bacterium]|nr:YncE family protein [Acidobacteriota bacterium]